MIRGSVLIFMELLSGAAVVLLGGCSINENGTGNATMITSSRPGWTDEEPRPPQRYLQLRGRPLRALLPR